MAGLNTNSLLDVFNAGSQFGGGVMDFMNEQLRQRDDEKLRGMQLQFINDTNQFLNKLQTEQTFDTWPEQFNKFMQDTQGTMGKETNADGNPNPYYVNSKYLEKKATDWFNQQYIDLQNKVTLMTLGKVQEQSKAIGDRNNDKALNTMPAKEAIAFCMQTYNDQYTHNQINSPEYIAGINATIDAAMDKAMNDAKDNLLLQFDPSVSPTKALSMLDNMLESQKGDFTVEDKVNGGVVTASDRNWDSKKTKIKKDFQNQWQAKIEDQQKENAKQLANVFKDMEKATTKEEKLQQAQKGQELLDRLSQRNGLSEEDIKHYASLFAYKIENPAGSSGGSKTSDKLGNAITAMLKEERQRWIQEFKNGKLGSSLGVEDAYVARQAFEDAIYKSLSDWRDSNGDPLSNEEFNQYFNSNRTLLDTFVDDAVESLPYGNKKWIRDYLNDFCIKQKLNPSPEQISYLVGSFQDILSESDQQNWTEEKAQSELARMIGGLTAMQLDALTVDRNGKLNADLRSGAQLGKALLQLEANDVLFEDYAGKTRSMPITSKKGDVVYAKDLLEGKGGLIEEGKNQIAAALGINNKDIDFRWERTKNGHDINTVPVFTVDGIRYQLEAIDKNGKPTKNVKDAAGVQIKGLKQNEYGEVVGEQVLKNEVVEKNQAKQEKKNAKNKGKDFDAQRGKEAQQLDYRQVDLILRDLDPESFRSLQELQGGQALVKRLEKAGWYDKQQSRLKEVQNITWENKGVQIEGVTKEKWEKLSPKEKLKLLEIAHYQFKDLK